MKRKVKKAKVPALPPRGRTLPVISLKIAEPIIQAIEIARNTTGREWAPSRNAWITDAIIERLKSMPLPSSVKTALASHLITGRMYSGPRYSLVKKPQAA
jgi:hypothetical protein